jgi:Methylase involved in ubiquinone/menaquinone biosynthesis
MSPESNQGLVEYYARRAAEYETIFSRPERQEDLGILRGWIGDAFSGMNILEIACGTGYWTEVISRTAKSVLATDVNEETLAIARSKGMNSAKVRFQKENALSLLHLVNQRFNAGFAGFWWSHLPMRGVRDFLNGFHSALQPGALVCFIDNRFVEGSSTPISRRDSEGNTFQMRRLSDGSVHEVLKNFPDEGRLRSSLSGLATELEVRWLRYYWLLSYRACDAA